MQFFIEAFNPPSHTTSEQINLPKAECSVMAPKHVDTTTYRDTTPIDISEQIASMQTMEGWNL